MQVSFFRLTPTHKKLLFFYASDDISLKNILRNICQNDHVIELFSDSCTIKQKTSLLIQPITKKNNMILIKMNLND